MPADLYDLPLCYVKSDPDISATILMILQILGPVVSKWSSESEIWEA